MKVSLKDICFYNESGLLEYTFLAEVKLDNGKVIKKEYKTDETRKAFLRGLHAE